MRFEWDEAKNRINIQKHGIDFNDAVDIFNHPLLALPDEREGYDEERWIALGWIRTLLGVVVYTERRGDVIRIISARKATRGEVRHYEQRIG
ncbi:MAG: BrnT family toxin [Pseudomonas sp.]